MSIGMTIYNMKKEILKLLRLSQDAYEMRIFCTYMDWCTKHCKSDNEMQRFLTSPALFNWWTQEYSKLETNFLKIVKPYQDTAHAVDLDRIYLNETVQIFNRFCKPLIYTARYKNQNVVNPNHN